MSMGRGALVALIILGLSTNGRAVPAAPTPLTPSIGASVTVPFTISWSAVSDPAGINGYNWQVSASPTFTPLIRQDSTAGTVTNAIVSGLPVGTYFWRVQAANGALEVSPWSATRSVTVTGASAGTPGTPVLDPPVGYSTFHPWEAVRFTWGAVADAATYFLQVSNDASLPVGIFGTFLGGANSDIGTDIAFDPGGNVIMAGYTYSADFPTTAGAFDRVFNGDTVIFWGDAFVAKVATGATPPPSPQPPPPPPPLPPPTSPLPAPSLLSPAADARFAPGTTITFDWTDVAGAATYTLQIDNSQTFAAPFVVNQTTAASQYATSALPTTRMWFRVRANNASGMAGTWSSSRRFEVK